MVILFWGIFFPFHAKRFKTAHHFRYIHIASIVAALLLPATPIVAAFANSGTKGAYRQTRYPPILCAALDRKASFYGVVMPGCIMIQIGITLLIFIFWRLHKVCASIICKHCNVFFTPCTDTPEILHSWWKEIRTM